MIKTEEPSETAPPTARSLGNRAARGAVFLSVKTVLIQLIQVVSSVLLARKLAPELYGAFALGATLVGFGRIIGDCGAGNAVIQASGEDSLSRATLRSVHFIQITVSTAAALILIAAAPTLRGLFDGPPETVGIVYVMTIALLIEAPAMVPRLRLTRELKFERLAAISAVSFLALYIAQILLLLLGFGIWALVIGQVVNSAVNCGLTVALGGGSVLPSFRGAWALFRKGIAYQGTIIAMGFLTMPAVAVVGTIGGAEVLGFWTWSTVLVTPLVGMLANVYDVGFPTLARLHEHDRTRHRDAVALIARSLSLIVGASVGILAGFAPQIVRIIFSEKWLPAVGAVRAALFGGIALALTSLLSAAVQSIGRPGVRFRSYLVAAVVGLALLIPLVRTWGATGGAVAIYLIVPAVDLVILIAVVRARLQRAVVNLVVVTTATLAWSLALGRGVDSFMRLALAGIVSGVLACILMMLTDGRALVRSISFVRNRTPPS